MPTESITSTSARMSAGRMHGVGGHDGPVRNADTIGVSLDHAATELREFLGGERRAGVVRSASSSALWRKSMAPFCPLYRTMAPDLIGYGTSAPWPDTKSYSIDSETGALAPILPCCDHYHLVGYSYGGVSA